MICHDESRAAHPLCLMRQKIAPLCISIVGNDYACRAHPSFQQSFFIPASVTLQKLLTCAHGAKKKNMQAVPEMQVGYSAYLKAS